MLSKPGETECGIDFARPLSEFTLHELQVASLYGHEYQTEYIARLKEVARRLAESAYCDPSFDAAHEGVSREEVIEWLAELAMRMIEEDLSGSEMQSGHKQRTALEHSAPECIRKAIYCGA